MDVGLNNSAYNSYSQPVRTALGRSLTKMVVDSKSSPLASAKLNIRDEYIPSATAALAAVSSAERKGEVAFNTGNAASVQEALVQVLKSHGVQEDELVAILIVIDKNGQFQSGGGSVNNQCRNWDDSDQGEIGEIINDLNNLKVNGVPLAEVMLQEFAEDTGMDLSAERQKDSFYFTAQIINPLFNDYKPDAESLVEVVASVVTVDNTFYAREKDMAWGVIITPYYNDRGEQVEPHVVRGNVRAAGINYMDAPWNQGNTSIKPDPDLDDTTHNAEPSTKSELRYAQNALHQEIARILLENGFDFEHYALVFTVSNAGVFSFDRNDSRVPGLDEDAVSNVCTVVESKLNASSFFKEHPPWFE